MSFKSNSIRLLNYLNEEKIFPILLIFTTLVLTIINYSAIYYPIKILLFFVFFFLPLGIRFGIFNLTLVEEVEQDDYKLTLHLVKSFLVEYQLKVEEGKFKYKIIKNDFKNIAIMPLFNKIIISTGFLTWANEKNNRHIKPIIAHEVSHNNRFLKFLLEIFFLPYIVILISSVFIPIISSYLLSLRMILLTLIISFLIQFVTFFSVYLVVFWSMRRNEYLADKGSVIFGNLPNDMIEALSIILEDTEEKIKNPPKLIEIFNTHPSFKNRVKKLRVLE